MVRQTTMSKQLCSRRPALDSTQFRLSPGTAFWMSSLVTWMVNGFLAFTNAYSFDDLALDARFFLADFLGMVASLPALLRMRSGSIPSRRNFALIFSSSSSCFFAIIDPLVVHPQRLRHLDLAMRFALQAADKSRPQTPVAGRTITLGHVTTGQPRDVFGVGRHRHQAVPVLIDSEH